MLTLPPLIPQKAAAEGSRNENALQGLGFLVGDYWVAQGKEMTLIESFAWAPHGVFLTSEQTVLLGGGALRVTGGIGWMAEDPTNQQLRMWKYGADSSIVEGRQCKLQSNPPEDPYWAFTGQTDRDDENQWLIVLIKNDENTLTVESRSPRTLSFVYKRQPPIASQ